MINCIEFFASFPASVCGISAVRVRIGIVLVWELLFWFYQGVCLTGSLVSGLVFMCGVIRITVAWGLAHIWCGAYMGPGSLLVFLSEAIWLFGEGSVCDCNLSTSCMCLFPNSLLRQKHQF